MNQIPEILYGKTGQKTWCIVGASRGIGLEFVRQLIAREDRILATVRDVAAVHASGLWAQAGGDHGRCQMLICDVLSEQSINVYSTLLSYHSFFSSLSFLPFISLMCYRPFPELHTRSTSFVVMANTASRRVLFLSSPQYRT
jgi:hypothetical protein